jgi:hypothetical protein
VFRLRRLVYDIRSKIIEDLINLNISRLGFWKSGSVMPRANTLPFEGDTEEIVEEGGPIPIGEVIIIND